MQANWAAVLPIIAAEGTPDHADVLDRIGGLAPEQAGNPMTRLMRARALLLDEWDERDEAMKVFRDALGSAAA